MKRADLRIALAAMVGVAGAIAAVALFGFRGGDEESVAAATPTMTVQQAPEPGAVPAPRSHHPTKPVSSLRTMPATGPAFAAFTVDEGAAIQVRKRPGGPVVATLGGRTEFGSQRTVAIVRTRGSWLGVIAPELGNGVVGWTRYDPNRMERFWTKYSLSVDLSERRLALRYGDTLVGSFPVTVGGTGSETPVGRFAVTDGIRFDASPYYGCCAIATSGHQPNLPPGWIGGDRIAIHGTPGPVGLAESHGCLRATDATMEILMGRIPLGTPVFVHA